MTTAKGALDADPVPIIQSITLDGSTSTSKTIALGETVTIEVSVNNNGGTASNGGYVGLSFPNLTTTTSKNYVSINISSYYDYRSNGAFGDYQEYANGTSDLIYSNCYNPPLQVTPLYLLAEGFDQYWPAGATEKLVVDFTPPDSGTYQINITSAMATDSGGYTYYPTSSSYLDSQQCEYALRRTIYVEAAQPDLDANINALNEPWQWGDNEGFNLTLTNCH